MIKSLDEDPDFMEDRPPLVVPLPEDERGRFIVFAGNERTDGEKRRKAVKELACIVYVPESEEDQKTIIRRAMKDNGHFADWDEDTLANEWDIFLPELASWGVNLPFLTEEEQKEQEIGEEFSDNIGKVLYDPKDTAHKVGDLYKDEGAKFAQMIEALQDEDLKKMLRLRAAWFTEFDFAKVADYYAYQATPEEQRVFEALGLVLLDKDQLIENGFANIIADFEDEENH
ncbi:MAG: hypothetical protein II841_04840 [Bacteroidales bacterium]|nr:hypothetical protein [Bacteroidales bacterium]